MEEKNRKNIMNPIEFISTQERGWNGEKTLNSSMKLVYAHFYLLLIDSIHSETNKIISEGKKEKKEGYIVSKRTEKGAEQLFLTETKILKFLKAYQCEQICSYYTEPLVRSDNPEVQ